MKKTNNAFEIFPEWVEQQSLLSERNSELQKAKEKAEESEKRYRLLIDNIMYPVLVTSFEGSILYINQKTADFLDVKADEYKELKSLDLWVYKAKRDEYIVELRATGFILNKEVQFRNKRGQIITVIISSNIIDYYGQKAIFSIYNDISKLKKAEDELRESQRKLVTLMGNLPGLAYRCKNDQDWTMIFMSEGCFELTGFYSQELEGNQLNSYGKLIHQNDAKMVWQKVQDAINNHTFWQIEYRIHTKEGIEKWVWEQGCGVYSNAGDLEVLEGFISDITERKKAEESLTKSEERHRYILENAPIGIFQRTLGGPYNFCNKTLANHFECESIDEFLQNYNEIPKRWANLDKYTEYIDALVNNGKVLGFEVETKLINGKTKWFYLFTEIDNSKSIINGFSLDITEWKRSEDLRRKSEEKFSKTFRVSPEAISINRLSDGKYIDANDACLRKTGFTREEMIGKTSIELNLWADPEDRIKYIHALEKDGKVRNLEMRLRMKSGERRYFLASTEFIEAEDEKYILGYFFDITERKQAEEEFQATTAKLETIIMFSPLAIIVIDNNGNIQLWNKAAEQIFGWTAQEVIGNPNPVVPADKQNEYNMWISDILHGKTLINQEAVRVRKDGSFVDISISSASILDVKGNLIGRMAIVTDITERKKNDAILIKLYTAIDNSQASIVITDLEGNIEFANPYFTELTGYSKDEYLGKNPKILKSGLHTDEYYEKIWNTIKSGNTWEGEFCNRKKNGELYWEKSIITPIRNEKEEILNFVAIKSDITDRKEIENTLQESEELFRKVTTLSGYLVFDYNPDNGSITWNGAIEQLTDYTELQLKDMNYKKWIELVHPDDKELALSGFEELITNNIPFNSEYRLKIKSGDYTWIEALGFKQPASNLNGFKIIGIMRDISQYKTIEENILNRVINAEERERLHFSQEIHDGLGPLISAIRLYVQLFSEPESKMEKTEMVGKALELLNEASITLREISYKLSPHTLQNFGIVEALKSFIKRITDSNKIDIIFNCCNIERLKEITETIIYRIICECINNTIKHANANKILIEMALNNEYLDILYTDDGLGFNPEQILNTPKGVGLLNMKSRIKSINGQMNIKSRPGSGTSIHLKIKL